MDIFSVLRSIDVFSEFDPEALERLSRESRIEDCTSGQVILRFGQVVENLGVVASGKVEVRPDPTALMKKSVIVPEGQVFGEMSLLTGEPAIADVLAAVPTRMVLVPHASLTREIGKNPRAAHKLAKLLAARLVRRGNDPDEQAQANLARADALSRTSIYGEIPKECVLVLNMGSSSLKYALIVNGERRCSGLVERVGLPHARIRHEGPSGRLDQETEASSHEAGLRQVLDLLRHPEHGVLDRLEDITAVGHRVVHGGIRFSEATIIDAAVREEIRRNASLAPLHNPVNLAGIEICEKLLPPGIPQVAVFDTAFHMTMPEHAWRYAIPRGLADERQLRRFGFHGTSHKYVSETASAFLGEPPSSLRMVTCHLGNGASVAAVDHGRCVDTSMGLTPLEGLVMGTRSGDLDPGLLLLLWRQGMSHDQVDRLLNKESGLLGLSGLSSDMRELQKAADSGHPAALLAIQTFCYRVRKYIGAYAAAMGGLDALVFTGGIGENGDDIRSRVCHGLGFLGIEIDESKNRGPAGPGAPAKVISGERSRVRVLVVPTDEEGMIAAETERALKRSGVSDILKTRRDRPVPIGVSAHHVHLSPEHVEALFGRGRRLTPGKPLSQPGQYAAEEKVDLVGPKGRVERVRVLGPERPATQVEISRTEEFKLGIDAPIRASGDIHGSPGLALVGPKGRVDLREGVICALRHIHMAPEDALGFGLRDRDVVRVKVEGERSLIFGDVLVRIHPDFRLEMHIDTDEANAAEINEGMTATIESIQKRTA